MAPTTAPVTRRVAGLFDRVAVLYDDPRLQRTVYLPVQDQVLGELTRLRPRRVLDVGCGTGILASRIHEAIAPEHTYGCDPSVGMLANARARSSAVEWLDGTAEAIPLPDASVDAVITTTAFHFFDQPAALREFHRVLAPGGVALVAAATTLGPVAEALVAPIARLTGTGSVPSRASLRAMVTEAGFHGVHQLPPARGPLGVLDPMVVTSGRR